MAKSKRNAKKQMQVARPRAARMRAMPRGISGLDEAAACWARLLNDPCNAPLCHPVYSGGNGGILVRSCTYTNLTFGTNTAGYVFWQPGGGVSYAAVAAVDSTTTTFPFGSTTFVPGAAYLSANAGSFRCAAACLKVTWGGTELNRQGYVRFGNLNGSDCGVPGTTTSTVAGINNLLEGGTRMPEETLEIKWRPTDFDQQTCYSNNPDSSQDAGRRGMLGFTATSMPANSILIIETTAVYEYQPIFNLGVTAATASTTRSKNTMDHVIEALDKTGSWMYRIGHMVGQAVSLASTVYGVYTNPVGAATRALSRITYQPRAQIMG